MEAAAPTEEKCATTGGRDAKPKAAKKVLSKEEKGVEAAKHRGRRRNHKERNAATAAMEATLQTWQMQLKAGAAQLGLHPSYAVDMLHVKQERIIGIAPGLVGELGRFPTAFWNYVLICVKSCSQLCLTMKLCLNGKEKKNKLKKCRTAGDNPRRKRMRRHNRVFSRLLDDANG
jgi:hypothetical protein